MVANTQTLDWASADIILLWHSPKNIRKPDNIYLKLWGLIQTINTTSAELRERLAHANARQAPIIADTLAKKEKYYPYDDFPLIAFHPTKGSYHNNPLKTGGLFSLTLVFGGEHIHLAKDWLIWLEKRLNLENTGFELLPVVMMDRALQHHHVNLPTIDTLIGTKTNKERTFLIEMPANFAKPNPKKAKKAKPADSTDSDIDRLTHQFISNTKKRFIQWFPTQQTYLERYFDELTPHLHTSTFCVHDLHEHSINSISKSSENTPCHHKIQRHEGMTGWLTLKGIWANMDDFWQVLQSIHLLGQRTHINGLGYILPEQNAHHAPPTLTQQHILNPRHIATAVHDVLNNYDLEPEWDEKGRLMQADTLTARLHEQLQNGSYEPSPTTAFDIAKPHGGTRRIEQLSQHDMMVHRLVFHRLSPIIDQYQSPLSLGYRKGYSRQMAKDRINTLMKQGFAWVIEADIEDFFNSVPLDRLWQQLGEILPQREQDFIELIKRLMQVPYIMASQKSKTTTLTPRTTGLMQGSPLSPILANLYLSRLDSRLSHSTHADDIAFVRYADDVLIFCRHQTDATQTLQLLDLALSELGLNLSIAKTSVTKVSDGFEFLGYRFDKEGYEDKSIVPILKQRKPVIITGTRKYVGINGSAIEIRERQAKPKKGKKSPATTTPPTIQHVLQVIPLRRISQLIIMGSHSLSSPLLSACAKEKVSVHFVNEWGFQVGTMTPINAFYFGISAKQYHRHQAIKPSERIGIATDIVHAKINNYQTWIQNSYRKGDHIIQAKLAKMREQLDTATQISQVMGYEGACAKLCFERLQQCIIDEQKPAFSSHRRSRGGKDRLNSLLNFGYYWLFTRISALLRSHGLNPYLSFLHDSEQSYETLVYDIMEIFRVQVDKTVLRLINRKQIQDKDFHLHEQKGWLLNNNALHLFTNQLQATFTSEINHTVLEDIVLMQIRTIQNWATDGNSLIWFYWYADKDNKQFLAHDDHREPMTIDHIAPLGDNHGN